MPKRTDIHRILIIGSGPIVIGQACEFDYSGTQAVKALREEGYEVILVNSNPATIMTDRGHRAGDPRDFDRGRGAGRGRRRREPLSKSRGCQALAGVFALGRREKLMEGRDACQSTSSSPAASSRSWFVVTQAHPEFKSRPIKNHPLFRVFVEEAAEHRGQAASV